MNMFIGPEEELGSCVVLKKAGELKMSCNSNT